MSTPTSPGAEVDEDTRLTLEERLKTIERDVKDSEEWTMALKEQRIRQLNAFVPQ